jgi:hypothetical protein
LFFLQDDLKKFVSELPSPPQLVEVSEEGKTKAKERREVGEGDDTVVVEDTWDTVGEAAGSRSPAPTVEELLAQMERQPPAAQGSTEPASAAAGEAAAAEAQDEAPAEAGLVDIASILGAPTVTVVRSSL